MIKDEVFSCDMCGMCCCNLKKSNLYAHLDRGDGVCRHYDTGTHLCTIYEHRPLLCNIDAYYDRYLQNTIPRHKFHELNHDICKMLRKTYVFDT